jgi:hypothetical protein
MAPIPKVRRGTLFREKSGKILVIAEYTPTVAANPRVAVRIRALGLSPAIID